jgi:tetratricopeptide (TPR) repeat protein
MFRLWHRSLALVSLALSYNCGSDCLAATTADRHFKNAMELRFQGQSDVAALEYERGLSLSPNRADAHTQLGIILMDEKGDLDGAISEFVTALGADPGCRFCQSQLDVALARRNGTSEEEIARGNRYYSAGELKRALAAYRVASGLNPGDASAHNSQAWTLYRLGNLDEGLVEVKEALRLKPDDPEYINTLASLLLDKGELKAAQDTFNRAISLSKTAGPADLYGLAAVAISQGDARHAAEFFSEAIKIDPNFVDSRYLRDRIGLSPKTLATHEKLRLLLAK